MIIPNSEPCKWKRKQSFASTLDNGEGNNFGNSSFHNPKRDFSLSETVKAENLQRPPFHWRNPHRYEPQCFLRTQIF
ncbi:hypothetical protein CEXT_327101 [Caerostris extrusa]|uniref:Uncharacterized protein n=1 Tax=Caerostris extrusa TaxID=172846 RepID=A0AAV4RZA6_CAEEX|nr:hypothetical protein CEXT_327101 [Caerostris extrusa]